MARISLGAAALIAAALTFSAAAETPAEMCAKTACREGGYSLALFFDKERFTTINVTHSPYVLEDGTILIFPGETLAFELPAEGDKVGTPKFLATYAPDFPMPRDPQGPPAPPSTLPKAGKLPPNTLLLSYGQTGGRGEGEPMMMLMLKQTLPKMLKLDAIMTVIRPHETEYRQVYTSTCPVMPNGFGTESWPNALGPLMLRNVRILADGAPMVCN